MNLIAWVILGILAGAIGKAIYPGKQGGGFIKTMLLGIIGSFVGGSIMTLITTKKLALTSTAFSIPGVFVAVLGAMLAIFLWELYQRKTS